MTDVLADYLKIYDHYPKNAFINKAQRKACHAELVKWKKQEYQAMPNVEELIDFMRTNESLCCKQPFIHKVVVPCAKKDIGEGNTNALKFLFECTTIDDYGSFDRDYVNMFCSGTDYQYDAWDLADMVLSKEPDNEIVLHYKYISVKNFLSFSIHEVPYGILSRMDGAEKGDMSDLFKILDEFIILSKKLRKDDSCFIQECKALYSAYEQYLGHIDEYSNFEDYLIKHNIAY